MKPNLKPKILVADDEPDLRAAMREILERAGFAVETAPDGDKALAAIYDNPPDIAILDLAMPGLDGFAVCRRLRQNPLYEHLPVIMLSACNTRDNKIEGLDLGADDFIAKPVDFFELLARIRAILKRSRQDLDASPLTHLPGNASIETRVEEAVADGRPLAVLYIDLNQFKAFNDVYGYDAGDRVLKSVARLLINLSGERFQARDFIGHIGGDDFIVITTPAAMEETARRIIEGFDAMAPSFYNEEDRRRGHIVSTDRQGNVQEFPLLSVAIGICHNSYKPLNSYAQVSAWGAELKKSAKEKAGSACVIDLRRE